MVYRRARKMAICPLDEALFCELVLFAWQRRNGEKNPKRIHVNINSVKGGIKPRTSSWETFLLVSRGGLIGAFDVALGVSGKTAFVMSPPEIEPVRGGVEVLSFWP